MLRTVCNHQLHCDQETTVRNEHWSQVSRKFDLGTTGRCLSASRSGRSVLLDNCSSTHRTEVWVAPEPMVALKKTSEEICAESSAFRDVSHFLLIISQTLRLTVKCTDRHAVPQYVCPSSLQHLLGKFSVHVNI